jgi:hypothetical protein
VECTATGSVFTKFLSLICFFFRTQMHLTFWSHLNQRRAVMQVLFKSRDPQADELRDVAQRRARFVFRRLDWLVPKAIVQLSDVNGPRGGLDKRCQVEIRSDVAGTVVVASVARDWRTALDNALSRALRFLMRQWRRGNEKRSLRQRALPLVHQEQHG